MVSGVCFELAALWLMSVARSLRCSHHLQLISDYRYFQVSCIGIKRPYSRDAKGCEGRNRRNKKSKSAPGTYVSYTLHFFARVLRLKSSTASDVFSAVMLENYGWERSVIDLLCVQVRVCVYASAYWI